MDSEFVFDVTTISGIDVEDVRLCPDGADLPVLSQFVGKAREMAQDDSERENSAM